MGKWEAPLRPPPNFRHSPLPETQLSTQIQLPGGEEIQDTHTPTSTTCTHASTTLWLAQAAASPRTLGADCQALDRAQDGPRPGQGASWRPQGERPPTSHDFNRLKGTGINSWAREEKKKKQWKGTINTSGQFTYSFFFNLFLYFISLQICQYVSHIYYIYLYISQCLAPRDSTSLRTESW